MKRFSYFLLPVLFAFLDDKEVPKRVFSEGRSLLLLEQIPFLKSRPPLTRKAKMRVVELLPLKVYLITLMYFYRL